MLRASRAKSVRRAVLGIIGVATAVAASVLGAAPASAATINVTYPVTGTTVIKNNGSTLPLGPGSMKTTVVTRTGGGDLTGTLDLPPTRSTFTVGGIIPAKATVTIIPAGPVTGKIEQGVVTAHSDVYIQLSDIWVAGIFHTPVGNECRTETPVGMDLKSEGAFTVFNGGTVAGTYTIPDFANCTIFGPLLSSQVSGPGNTISLLLGKPTQP
ncbi:hypothetical protein [Amycolatopsis anabasis]|uniref:hypothetical protein n=1 Tax=Amycolatopsis anabasis TaxID=1840409 RepID=UPI00131E64CB|nr:hypothetical protein [Amycolatopsis anabasis]